MRDFKQIFYAAQVGPKFGWHKACAWMKLEVVMATETDLFYLVILIVLTLIIHLVLSATDHRRGPKTR